MAPTKCLAVAAAIVLLLYAEASAQPDADCQVAQTAFSDCTAYVADLESAVSPRCCAGLGDIKDLAQSEAQRRAMCTCILQEMVQVGKVDNQRTSDLPATCAVTIDFLPTTLNFDCSQVS